MDNPVQDLLSQLRTGQASSPALIWYGADGERVELSGRVLENWTAKTANLFLEELDAAPDTVLEISLPVHWKTVALVLGAWACGSAVRRLPEGGEGSADPVESEVPAAENTPAGSTGGAAVFATAAAAPSVLAGAAGIPVAVALGALQTRWEEELPADGVDYAAAVRSFADSFDDYGHPDAGRPALSGIRGQLDWADLARPESQASQQAPGAAGQPPVVLVEAGSGLVRTLDVALGTWYAGGTVVLAGPGAPLEELAAAERVTARAGA